LTIPELILIAGTCVALGVGLGLLIGDKLGRDVRKGAGSALLGMGAVTTGRVLNRKSRSDLHARANELEAALASVHRGN
jgi:hypothetical protein